MLVLVATVAIPVVVPMAMMVPVVMLMMPTIMIQMSMPAFDTMHYATGDALAWILLRQAGAPVASMIPAEAANMMIFLSIMILLLTIELFLRKRALPLVGRITIEERISPYLYGFGCDGNWGWAACCLPHQAKGPPINLTILIE